MDTWLGENRRQYRIFVGLLQLLLDRGFSPLSTEPASETSFRTDHTEAMIALLKSFSPGSMTWPLRVFSTGPLFRPGRTWTDALDVEWLGPIGAPEEREVIELVSEMARWLSGEGVRTDDLTMVFGHTGWLKLLGDQLGMTADRIEVLVSELRRGRLTSVGELVAPLAPEAVELFHPQGPEEFFSCLARYLNVSIPPVGSDRWDTRWDLSLTGRRGYYTGLVFSLYHRQSGQPLVNGGTFSIAGGGEPSEGIGFTLDFDACRTALGEISRVV